MKGINNERYSHTKIGLVAIVPRPTLNQVNVDENGQPKTVQKDATSWTSYTTILGIQVEDYQERKPILVVYKLGNGVLLAATPDVIESSAIQRTSGYHNECYITEVSNLQVIDSLPESIIDFSKFKFDLKPYSK